MGVSALNWTKEDMNYLKDQWGELSVKTIAKHLGRSEDAIIIKAQRSGLSLSDYFMDCMTLNQLSKVIGQCPKKLLDLEIPVKRKRNAKSKCRVVYIDEEFWAWVYNNRYKVSFKNFESGSLGPEPDWVDKKRQSDKKKSRLITNKPWSQSADNNLMFLLEQHKFGYADIARILGRTEGAIKRRILDLGTKLRPIKADDHKAWESSEEEILKEMYYIGYTVEDISEKIGTRTVLAVKGKIERMILEGELE